MRELEAARDGGDGPTDARDRGKIRLKRYTIHGELLPREEPLHEKSLIVSREKHTVRVTGEARAATGKAFLAARQELNLSQAEVGKRFKKSQNAVYNWEAGKTAVPIEAIRWISSKVSPVTRRTLLVAAGIEDDTEGLLSITPETRSIPLLASINQLGDPDAKVDRSIALPTEWLPEEANIKAARFSSKISSIFGDELIALIDIRYPDPEKLVGCIVVTRTPRGNEPRTLRKLGRTFYLESLRGEPPQQLEREGVWSIIGTVIKWIADAPSPRK
jgi:transcriptional regulator with XRE-family HTH domain